MSIRRILLAAAAALAVLAAFPQQVKTVEAVYTYHGQENETLAHVKRTALERARIQAIADAFGTVVSQTNSTRISNENGQTDTRFLSVGGSQVKGEWIETLGEPEFTVDYGDNIIAVTCRVRGRAREIPANRPQLTSKILRNGTEPRYEAEEFTEGDDMFLYFRSPVEGSLLVFMIDAADNAWCLLPYARSGQASYRVRSDRPYVFFATGKDADTPDAVIDEYTLTCDGPLEQNEIITVFTPSALTRPAMTFASASVPGMLPAAQLRKWLAETLRHDANVQSENHIITIKKQQQ